MLKHLALALAMLFASPALAQETCPGEDLIAQMPADARAQLQARAAAVPYNTGLLWRATRGDTILTLFGTYHFAHDQTDAHLAALAPLIDSADLVFLESSPADAEQLTKEMASDPSLIFIVTGPTLPELLPEDDWQTLAARMKARGFPPFVAAKMKPFFTAMMLGISPCVMRAQKSGVLGIDQRIGQRAVAQAIPTHSLEDYHVPLRLLDSFAQDDQIGQLRMALAMDARVDDMTATLTNAYLGGQISLTWELARDISLAQGGPTAEADFQLLEDLILTRRNTAWIGPLLEQSAGQHAFVAAGAAHMPGETGVLNLLAQQGFAITPLPFAP